MKMLPNGVSNYEELVKYNCYYVDKTEYIEKLENLSNRRVMFLRPKGFGKTLFTSTLECYYDVNKKNKFNELFGNTYIGKNPTPLKNSYYILRFDFSGIDTSSYESTIKGFKMKTLNAIKLFLDKYNIIYEPDETMDAENILDDFFRIFIKYKNGEKLYVIIDEYDHFANELLSFDTSHFIELISRNGKVRKWYETLKLGTFSVVERIFITGVAPITLDSLTSGFNIETDLTTDEYFNEMLGFTEEELIDMMNAERISKEKQAELMPIMRENYDGYKFSKHSKTKIYNSNMCLFF